MLVAVIIRNYKSYENLNFVPIVDNEKYKYTVYVGNNGVGKSGILEAIDVALNDKEWNITTGAKKTEAFICPIFLIPKTEEIEQSEVFNYVGEYFWESDETINPNLKNSTFNNFFKYRNSLKSKYETTHNLILIGSAFNSKDAYFTTFHDNIIKYVANKDKCNEEESKQKLTRLRESIFAKYNYLYIPVEQSLYELLKLEAKEMQLMLNKDLLSEIEKILNQKNTINGNNKTIVTHINNYLDEFIGGVNEKISQIDNNYKFEGDTGVKKLLTAKDVREKILEAYFPLRALKMNGKKISQLSSGEQRKALIDVAYSILSANGNKQTEKKIILAIDEPETSMHISNCFRQFQMLEELATKYDKQVMLTTHWYGFLPITQQGNMHHISIEDKEINISTFDFYNYLEDRRKYPDVIELKSMFDLATSILTYMRNNSDIKWIICEGTDDKLYLEQILSGMNQFNFLPVGGCGNVVKLYQLLYGPMTEKNEVKTILSKVLFLIDTDLQMKFVNQPVALSSDKPNIFLRRLQIINDEVKLIDPLIPNAYEQTEIEDCIDPTIYFQAISDCINASNNEGLKNIVAKFKLVDNAKTSRLKGDSGCIIPADYSVINNKIDIIDFAGNSDNKYSIANRYIELCKEEKPYYKMKDEILALFY